LLKYQGLLGLTAHRCSEGLSVRGKDGMDHCYCLSVLLECVIHCIAMVFREDGCALMVLNRNLTSPRPREGHFVGLAIHLDNFAGEAAIGRIGQYQALELRFRTER